jgi:hypothetical protein
MGFAGNHPKTSNCLLRAVILMAVFQALVFHGNASAAPRIAIDHQFWDFGRATNLPSISHDYCISNAGDAPLIINSVVSTCSVCLRATIDKTNLPPGAVTFVHAVLNLRLLSGPTSRAILITCNDPQNPNPVLELNGEIVLLYQVDPVTPVLDLAEGPGTVTAGITPFIHLHAPLSQAVCNDTNVHTVVAPEPGGGCLLTVSARKGFPQSNTVVNVVVRSADTNDPPCSVDVFVRNAPTLELVPTQLVFQPQSDEQTRVLWLRQHGPSPLTLLDAVLPQDRFHCEIDPDPDGRNYTIYVTAWQQQTMAGQTNELVLKMMDASKHEKDIKVPVYAQKP